MLTSLLELTKMQLYSNLYQCIFYSISYSPTDFQRNIEYFQNNQIYVTRKYQRQSQKSDVKQGELRRTAYHKPEQIDGKRYQQVDIFYNGVGIIREPSPEEMEEYSQAHLKRTKAKTA